MLEISTLRLSQYLNKKLLKLSNNTYNPKNINFVLKNNQGDIKGKVQVST